MVSPDQDDDLPSLRNVTLDDAQDRYSMEERARFTAVFKHAEEIIGKKDW